jgi:hypothetical protein
MKIKHRSTTEDPEHAVPPQPPAVAPVGISVSPGNSSAPIVQQSTSPNSTGQHLNGPDWTTWMRLIERKRRMLERLFPDRSPLEQSIFPRPLLGRLTSVSFRLDGMEVTETQVMSAMEATPVRRPFRSRLSQRLRNHLAILRAIQRSLAAGKSLKTAVVVRWYTSLSSGLCTSALDEPTMDRLSAVVGRISSPMMRLQPAMQEVARLHAQLIADPLVPSFNGILSRLLLCFHLGRCGLPPVVFDPVADRRLMIDEKKLLPRLMELVDGSYSMMLAGM